MLYSTSIIFFVLYFVALIIVSLDCGNLGEIIVKCIGGIIVCFNSSEVIMAGIKKK